MRFSLLVSIPKAYYFDPFKTSSKLFAELVKKQGDKNIFISPLSIGIALAMTSNGASGETRAAVLETLELGEMSLEEVNQAQVLLRDTLQKLAPEVQLSIANSLWGNKEVSFSNEFLETNRKFYEAEITALDFGDPESVETINEWVREKTNGKIQNIVEELDPYGVLALLNVIYFKGAWLFPFEKEFTSEGTFTLLDGSNKQASMMFQMNEYEYYQDAKFQAISLDYALGGVSMYIFLPAKDSNLNKFYQGLSHEHFEIWLTRFKEKYGKVSLPLFTLEYEAHLEETLTELGMRLVFDKGEADFRRMVSFASNKGDIFISKARHKTFISVDEEGTEAAAVLSDFIVLGFSDKTEEEFVVEIDRPFFYVIMEIETGAILFMGATVEPE